MAEALSLKPSISIFRTSSSHANFSILHRPSSVQFRHSTTSKIQTFKPSQSLQFSGVSIKPLGFSLHRKSEFSSAVAENGEGETESVVDGAEEEARGQSTMPSRFRYLTKEAPDRPVRWPWLIALAFGIYAWRSVLWELSNWKKAVVAIAGFLVYLSKFALALIFHFIGDPLTSLIRFIETALYSIQSIYSGIVASAPVSELTLIIMLTSAVVAVAEATVPDSASSQPYLFTLTGIIGFASVLDFIPELPFWMLLVVLFCFSRFYKKRDAVTSALPVAAVLTAVGQPWVRLLVMISYLALTISHHSNKGSEGSSKVEDVAIGRRPPLPLVGVALAIGIHVAAKWVRYRHLTWMIA